ncbi:MAG TPA: thiamine-phosphate kinase [Thermoanaerobaculia bacterium]|jgi:thiamine-monophosphate kinase|nr:thiamine-phosphate kinase [Thermoanaerobaculia bacterium]
MKSEHEIVARLRELFPRAGDDAAVLGEQVITVDMLIEDVDFTRAVPLRFIARKSLAVNLSDLAAMGAQPRYAVVALGLPEWVNVEMLIEALAEAAHEYDIEIVGGDLSRSEKLVISITAIGEAKEPLLRSGAKPGDRIYVSRPLGGAAAGLQFLGKKLDDMPYALREFAQSAVQRQIDPEPEIELGMKLAGLATACIDISDGLSTDLDHLCEASHVGAEIARERIPVFPGLIESGLDVREAVLNGGEEYALLFTSRLRESELSARVGRPVYAIGRIVEGRGVMLDGQPLPPRGWDHFAT